MAAAAPLPERGWVAGANPSLRNSGASAMSLTAA
jgi:hypothetical protein